MPDYWLSGKSREHYLNELETEARMEFEISALLLHVEPPLRAASVRSILDKATQYCQEVEKLFKAYGYVNDDARWQQQNHLRWTIQAHVLGKSFEEITALESSSAKKSEDPVARVRKAVRDKLTLIGLSIEPTFHLQKGRPRGTKDSHDRHIAKK
jgi:hypothetical protein